MKIILIILVPLFLLACSKVGVGYSVGTSQVQNRVDDAFDFHPRAKSKDVDRFLSEQFENNKKPFFIKVKDLLQKFEAQSIKKELTTAEVNELHRASVNFRKDIIEMFRPSFNKVLTEVGDTEIKVFKDYTSEQISEREEEVANKKSFKKKRLSSLIRVAEFFLDDLTKEQEALASKFVEEHLDFYAEQIQARKSFNQELVKLYPQKDKMINLSLAYYSGDSDIRTEIYKKQREVFEQDMKNFILSLWNRRTSEQTAFFQKRLFDVIAEIDKIITE